MPAPPIFLIESHGKPAEPVPARRLSIESGRLVGIADDKIVFSASLDEIRSIEIGEEEVEPWKPKHGAAL